MEINVRDELHRNCQSFTRDELIQLGLLGRLFQNTNLEFKDELLLASLVQIFPALRATQTKALDEHILIVAIERTFSKNKIFTLDRKFNIFALSDLG